MTLADVMFVLHAGRVEQSGTPLDIYHRPATRFVASFLGSPAMNFLDGRLEPGDGGSWVAVLGGARERSEARVKLDAESFGKSLAAGKAVTVGIRPHDFALVEPSATDGSDHRAAAGSGPAVAIEVGLAEALGGETYAHGTLAGQDVVVRLDPSCLTKTGDTLRVVPSDVHLFDPDSGRSLRC